MYSDTRYMGQRVDGIGVMVMREIETLLLLVSARSAAVQIKTADREMWVGYFDAK